MSCGAHLDKSHFLLRPSSAGSVNNRPTENGWPTLFLDDRNWTDKKIDEMTKDWFYDWKKTKLLNRGKVHFLGGADMQHALLLSKITLSFVLSAFLAHWNWTIWNWALKMDWKKMTEWPEIFFRMTENRPRPFLEDRGPTEHKNSRTGPALRPSVHCACLENESRTI